MLTARDVGSTTRHGRPDVRDRRLEHIASRRIATGQGSPVMRHRATEVVATARGRDVTIGEPNGRVRA
jgi:hypothetical protein